MTPEGKVKKKVKSILTQYPELYMFMPVPYGYGGPTVDFYGCQRGLFFAVETKAPGKKPTAQQDLTLQAIRDAGGVTFVVVGDDGLEELAHWLKEVEDAHASRNLSKA